MEKGTKLVCIKNDELKEYDVILGKKFSLVVGDVYTYIDRTMGDDVIGKEMEIKFRLEKLWKNRY